MGSDRVREHTWWERQLRLGYYSRGEWWIPAPPPQAEVERLELMATLREEWDVQYADLGEGSAHGGGTYLSVVVADDRGRAMCTFFVREVGGAAVELFVAEIHRGLPPNPYVEGMGRALMWRAEEVEHARRAPEERHMANPYNAADARPFDVEAGKVDRFAQLCMRHGQDVNADVDRNPGQRPARVEVDPAVTDGDARFRFPAPAGPWTVRGSVLAPALLALRGAGVRKVELGLLRQAIARM